MSDKVTGIRHLMMRDPKTGKFERLTGSGEQIDEALKTDTAFWIYTKDPSVSAFTDLLNRALDRPAEHVQVEGSDGDPLVIRWQRDEEPSDSPVKDCPSPDAEKNGNVEEIVCVDCQESFYDWWDADNHFCTPHPNTGYSSIHE
jgi:hypothetical protein